MRNDIYCNGKDLGFRAADAAGLHFGMDEVKLLAQSFGMYLFARNKGKANFADLYNLAAFGAHTFGILDRDYKTPLDRLFEFSEPMILDFYREAVKLLEESDSFGRACFSIMAGCLELLHGENSQTEERALFHIDKATWYEEA